jgi:hypothetical protein
MVARQIQTNPEQQTSVAPGGKRRASVASDATSRCLALRRFLLRVFLPDLGYDALEVRTTENNEKLDYETLGTPSSVSQTSIVQIG